MLTRWHIFCTPASSPYLFAKSVLKVGCSCERVFSEVSTCQKYLCDNFSTILNKLDAWTGQALPGHEQDGLPAKATLLREPPGINNDIRWNDDNDETEDKELVFCWQTWRNFNNKDLEIWSKELIVWRKKPLEAALLLPHLPPLCSQRGLPEISWLRITWILTITKDKFHRRFNVETWSLPQSCWSSLRQALQEN